LSVFGQLKAENGNRADENQVSSTSSSYSILISSGFTLNLAAAFFLASSIS